MNQHRTTSILQRVPVILAVTAASYGLPAQAQTQPGRSSTSMGNAAYAGAGTPARDRAVHETVSLAH